jgi:hypothetical protein
LLSADDGVHAVAYDALKLTVAQTIRLAIAPLGKNVSLTWTGGSPPYVVELSHTMPATSWSPVLTNSGSSAALSAPVSPCYFRVRSN